MEFFAGVGAVPPGFGPSAVTIGKFDGVHIGHRAVIAELRSVAAERGLVATVVTFDRHPLSLLAPGKSPPRLVSNAQEAELLADAGVDATLLLAFDRAFSECEPERFVTEILVETLHAQVVLVGSDFRFGAKGAGDVALLEELGQRYGFEVRRIHDVVGGEQRRASSTWIRELLADGGVAAASVLLDRPPTVRSVVVPGQRRGRELGYPTANLDASSLEGLIPSDGVYAAWATIDGIRYGAAVSIGNNPTFEGVPQKQVEAHLLDQDIDVYGRTIELAFVAFVRPMTKFDSIDALVEQMTADESRVRAVLGFQSRSADRV